MHESAVDTFEPGGRPSDWNGGSEAAPEPTGPSLERYISALNRFKWMIITFAILGGAGGYTATRFIEPEYEVKATILLEQGTGTNQGSGRGPIQAEELLQASGWQDLLRSFAIADPVVNDLALFVKPKRDADSTIFRAFRVAPNQQRLRPGLYVLSITGTRYSLTLQPGIGVEKGMLGDSIGRAVGFLWQPPARALAGRKEIEFDVQTPREASIALIKKLRLGLQNGSSFLFLNLTGENAQRTAATLNAWVEQFVVVATALKKKNISSVAAILEGQTKYAEDNLRIAESALETFRITTVTEPNERAAASIAPGIEMTSSTVFDRYFRDQVVADMYKRDRQALEDILEKGRQPGGVITREALLSVPSVNQDPAAENLRRALTDLAERELLLRRLRESATDALPRVQSEMAALATLRASIPPVLEAYLAQVRLREQELVKSIEQGGKDLRKIPSRTIEEQRLKRQVDVNEAMYRNLNIKAAEAKLAEAATIPDVSILDPAVAPLKPTRNTAPVIILGSIGAALALGVLLAIIIDRVDKRFRYPEQAINDLGLFILGVVPVIDTKSKKKRSEDIASQVVEAFRTIRMNVRYAADPSRPLAFTITSPGPNDGKSLISANLALSFAESGARTLLIDGDLRRGELAKTFGIQSRSGLVEYLDGTALVSEVLHQSAAHVNLTIMGVGARRKRAPELLASARLQQLVNQMTAEFDVVICDSPPLGAGFDAFALASATGNLALVLRAGATDRQMAAARMATMRTLPIRIMGAVLNGIELKGVYEYYSYYQNYAAKDEEPVARITDGSPRSDRPDSGEYN